MPTPASQSQITVGDIRITYLPDGYTLLNPTAFLPASTPEAWQLHKQWLNDAGQLVASIGGLLIQTGDRTVLVDTGFGDKRVEFPGFGPFQGGELLNSFRSAGVDPADVNAVIYTHLHLDHVGWTSRVADGARALTFPNARYLMRGPEWEHWHGTDNPAGPGIEDVQQPLESRIELIEDGQVIAPGVNVLATPGHTPGHSSVVISSGGQRAIILGDVLHCPVQLDEPQWTCVFDVDPELGKRTRERLLQELEDPATVGASGHLADFTFGRVMRGQGKRQWVVGTAVG